MASLENVSEQETASQSEQGRSALLSVVAPVAGLLVAAFATTFAIAVGVPDETDYAKASVLKHAALAADEKKKIVLVGGSNFAYGMDSQVLSKATGCPVVNMGMNGYFGVRFMMEEVKPELHKGDIVVIAWEYDSFYKSVDGTNTDLLMVTKANPDAFRFLTPRQKVSVISRYPFVAQQKVLRLMGDGYEGLTHSLGAEKEDADPTGIKEVESLASFTPNGDLIGHLDKTWAYDLEDGLDMSTLPMDKEIVPLMKSFADEMNAKGVKVMVSWTPIIDDFYNRHTAEIERLSAKMSAIPEFNIARPAHDFVFPASQHFDTVFHLNAEGRAIRSEMLTEDILSEFGDDAICAPTP
jgi:hypothetical protein